MAKMSDYFNFTDEQYRRIAEKINEARKMKFTTYVTYGSYDAFINDMAASYGCPPDTFREIVVRHEHKNDGTSEGRYQVVFGYLDELKSLGYSRVAA